MYRVHPRMRRTLLSSAVAAVIGSAAHAQVQVEAAAGSPTEEIFVTGSRISRQGFDSPTPVTAIDNDYLLDLGFVNVGAAVQQMPANKASLTPETNGFGSFNVGAQIANLRALGAGRTLTLVDGRRHIASTDTANVDLNLIPPLLVERTEIVTGGASAAYGSDAVAGVINVILDKNLEGVRWQADVYQTGEGDGTSRHSVRCRRHGALRRPRPFGHRRRIRGRRRHRLVRADARLVPRFAGHRHEPRQPHQRPAAQHHHEQRGARQHDLGRHDHRRVELGEHGAERGGFRRQPRLRHAARCERHTDARTLPVLLQAGRRQLRPQPDEDQLGLQRHAWRARIRRTARGLPRLLHVTFAGDNVRPAKGSVKKWIERYGDRTIPR